MRESSCDAIVDLFTKGSHHKNLSVILISQNQGRSPWSTWSLNANYIVVFKNPCDRTQIYHLTRLSRSEIHRREIPLRGLTAICSIWNNQRTNIDFERVFFPRIRLITSTYRIDHFPANSYKRREWVIIHISRRFFPRWRWKHESDKKSHSATKIASQSIGKRKPVSSRRSIIWIKINAQPSYADEKLIHCIGECVFNTLKNNVSLERCEKNRLIKYKTVLRRIIAKRGNWKEKKACCSETDFYLILSGLYYIIGPILSTLLSLIIRGTK